jgi:hypothetical protein
LNGAHPLTFERDVQYSPCSGYGKRRGYVELDKLADALKQYADRPTDVRAFVDELMQFDES